MLRTALLSLLLLALCAPAAANAASAGVAGGVLAVQLGTPGYASVALKPAPCRETVHATLDADRSFVRDPAGCVEVRTESEDVAPGPGCAYASGSFRPMTTIAICGLSGIGEVVLHGTAGPDRLGLSAEGPHAVVLRVVGGPGNDHLSVGGKVQTGTPVDFATGQELGPGPTGATFVDGGEGDDTLNADTPATSAIACGPGADVVETSDEHHDVGPDCEKFKTYRPDTRPAGLPGRVGMENGTLVVDGSRYGASKLLGLSLTWGKFRGQMGWTVAEDARDHRMDTEQPRPVALATGAGCQAFVAETGSSKHWCPAAPSTPVSVRGPAVRGLALDVSGPPADAPIPAPVRVEGGRGEDFVAFDSPFRIKVFCGPGLDTVLAGSSEGDEARHAAGVNAWSEGDCEIPRGVKRLGTPAFGKLKVAARGVVGRRAMFPLTGAGAVVTVTCPHGRISCGGKMDMYAAGMRCGYLGTIPYSVDRGKTARVRLQFGTIEGELRCGSLLEPRSKVAGLLRRGAPAKVDVITRLGRKYARTKVTLRR